MKATPQFAILRFEKHQGNPARSIQDHHERNKERYASNPDIDISRSKNNFHIIKPKEPYTIGIKRRIAEAGCKTRKDSVRFVDTLITASPSFFEKKSRKEIHVFFSDACAFLEEKIGKPNIVSAVVHMDEKTPHLHVVFVPLTQDNRLCAKEIIGNRKKLIGWQDDFFSYMVARHPDLYRGESASITGRTHIPTRLYKEAAHLSKQAEYITSLLNQITPFNTRKVTEEIAAQLRRFFPRMERFQTQLNKYSAAFKALTEENAQLQADVKEASGTSMVKQMEDAKLRADLANMQRLLDHIPKEMLDDYAIQSKTQRKER